jgi:oligopeptide/dipeptide ABC transporter ATP-binding protein
MSEQAVQAPVRASGRGVAHHRADRLLEIRDLTVAFPTQEGVINGVDHLDLAVGSHERLGVVGESGSGKSVMGLAILGLVQPPGRIVTGSVLWRGENMLDPEVADRVRGREIAMIFQDPMVSLNPLKSVGAQIREVLRKRAGFDRGEAQRRAAELLELVGIAQPRERLKQYPYEFSGGMRQRVMIATALAGDPSLLVADEPTTGLDVTIQDQILRLLRELSEELGVSVLMITHDLGVIAEFCDRVQVMYAGRIVERSPVDRIFAAPLHPYTRGLMASVPRVDTPTDRLVGIPGEPLDRARLPAGCSFAPRCPEALDTCSLAVPDLWRTVEDRRWVACWRRQMEGVTTE